MGETDQVDVQSSKKLNQCAQILLLCGITCVLFVGFYSFVKDIFSPTEDECAADPVRSNTDDTASSDPGPPPQTTSPSSAAPDLRGSSLDAILRTLQKIEMEIVTYLTSLRRYKARQITLHHHCADRDCQKATARVPDENIACYEVMTNSEDISVLDYCPPQTVAASNAASDSRGCSLKPILKVIKRQEVDVIRLLVKQWILKAKIQGWSNNQDNNKPGEFVMYNILEGT